LVLVECSFLIPTVRDSDRQPHEPVLWEVLIAELFALFGGGQGPRYRLFVNPELLSGGWVPGGGEGPILDECREYRVAVEEERLDELRSFLLGIAAAFDQREIYLSVRGVVESVRSEERS
jgi:hypothetical protein